MPHNSRFAVSCAKGAALSADEIYRRSFALIDKETNFGAMEKEMRKIAARMIHACAMPDIIADLHWSRTAIAAGKTALRAGKPIFCDTAMVASGLNRKNLPAHNRIHVMIHDPRLGQNTDDRRTVSARAVDICADKMDGAVLVIGNAPTALFRLLELARARILRPGLVIALPVGFVGATEAKAELLRDSAELDYITLSGRRGGSAMAVACANGLLALAMQP